MNFFTATPTEERVARRRRAIKSLKAKINARRSVSEKLADWLTTSFGTVVFFVLNALFFVVWIFLNLGPNAFDPYPFGFLTMVVSLEAIFLSIIVLISQNREGKISELREEIELYINTYAEAEVTKIMHLLVLLLEKNGIDVSNDKELHSMLKSLRSDQIEEDLESQL
jgi:uncharacterized membrane protein